MSDGFADLDTLSWVRPGSAATRSVDVNDSGMSYFAIHAGSSCKKKRSLKRDMPDLLAIVSTWWL
jgi:hypothetical protein